MKCAPRMTDYLNEVSKEHFSLVKNYLDAMNIDYEVNSNIVRGLDYYTHTVFEVVADIKNFGSQNVLAGGGRYNNLVENIGGPSVPGVGFAIGVERLLLALEYEGLDNIEFNPVDVYIFGASDNEKEYIMKLANDLRGSGFKIDVDYESKSFKNNFKRADKLKSKFVIIIGEEEVKTKVLTVKNNKAKEEYKVSIDELVKFLNEKLGDFDED